MSLTYNSQAIGRRGSGVSRARPHHILPAFLNLHLRQFWVRFQTEPSTLTVTASEGSNSSSRNFLRGVKGEILRI